MRENTASHTARRVTAHRLDYARVETPYGDPAADIALARDVAGGLRPDANRMHEYLRARTAFFDQVVVRSIDRGIRQIVVGAAGYDGRALRYAKRGVRWFEVDHPVTQADKLDRMSRLGIDVGHVRFVAADFAVGPVAELLRTAGLDSRQPALFLLEGVAVYLDEPVLERVLAQFRQVTVTGSLLAISVSLTSTGQARERFAQTVAAMGEPVRSMLTVERARAVLARNGWLVTDSGQPGRPRTAGLLVARAGGYPDGSLSRLALAGSRALRHAIPVTELKIEVDPAEVGLDQGRLRRIDRHFARYVDDGRLAGWLLTVSRHGQLAHVSGYGLRDAEAGLPAEPDTLWRIYSMSKPVTSVAAMMLYEEGVFELSDPVSKFIPSFADMRVYSGGSDLRAVTVPTAEPVRIWHLLTHTSGLTYGFHRVHPADAMHRAAGFDMGALPPAGVDLERACDIWAGIPLLFQPGTEWNYSVSTDILGRVVEVASHMPLDEFFASRIFRPLGMNDTGFFAPPDQLPRMAALYGLGGDRKAVRLGKLDEEGRKRPDMLSGGAGLVSTAADYHRFTQMILGRPDSPAGELDGVRLLGPRTVAYMGRNHLPGGKDLETFGRPLFAETPFRGTGFGLGFAVVIDPVPGKVLCSPGELSWGGAASTAFWIDPAEQITVSFFAQLLPSSAHPIRSQLRQLVYQSLV